MNISIVGIGLIGGSMALAIRKHMPVNRIFGIDSNPDNRAKALSLGIVDEIVELEQGVRQSDLVIIATPVNHIVRLTPIILDYVDQQVVMDVGSTKEKIHRTIDHHPKRGRFVGTHPMAGTEFSGPKAAHDDLFENKCTVIVDKQRSDTDALEKVEHLYDQLGMRKVYHDSTRHDIHAAYISHISHISSLALALTVLEKEKDEKQIFDLAGGGFSSTVRLAKSNPNTWIPIFEQNRDHCLDVLDEHINTLSKFRSLLIKKDFSTFHNLMTDANQIKRILK